MPPIIVMLVPPLALSVSLPLPPTSDTLAPPPLDEQGVVAGAAEQRDAGAAAASAQQGITAAGLIMTFEALPAMRVSFAAAEERLERAASA